MNRPKIIIALLRQIDIKYMYSGKFRQKIVLKYGILNVNISSS